MFPQWTTKPFRSSSGIDETDIEYSQQYQLWTPWKSRLTEWTLRCVLRCCFHSLHFTKRRIFTKWH